MAENESGEKMKESSRTVVCAKITSNLGYYVIKIFAPDLDNCSEICKKDTRNYKD